MLQSKYDNREIGCNASSYLGNKDLHGYLLGPMKSKGLSLVAIVGIGLGSGLLSFTVVCVWLRVTGRRWLPNKKAKVKPSDSSSRGAMTGHSDSQIGCDWWKGNQMTVSITGATGFIGSKLVQRLYEDNHSICVLLGLDLKLSPFFRDFPGIVIAEEAQWKECIEGSTGVVNLAGLPISTRWSPEVKKEIKESRVRVTSKSAIIFVVASSTNKEDTKFKRFWIQSNPRKRSSGEDVQVVENGDVEMSKFKDGNHMFYYGSVTTEFATESLLRILQRKDSYGFYNGSVPTDFAAEYIGYGIKSVAALQLYARPHIPYARPRVWSRPAHQLLEGLNRRSDMQNASSSINTGAWVEVQASQLQSKYSSNLSSVVRTLY
ncbi:hypothetical protein LXL04_034002 [Taraxacum kok-saghyz]